MWLCILTGRLELRPQEELLDPARSPIRLVSKNRLLPQATLDHCQDGNLLTCKK